MTQKTYNVLFLCTGNSARSIIGEVLMNYYAEGRVKAYSAGSHPKGQVHSMALRELKAFGYPTEGLRSKSWDEFSGPDAPHFDFIFTVCDNAAGETCPVWLGHPVTAHWGIEDPAAVEGDGQSEAFVRAMRHLLQRIDRFLELPLESLDEAAIAERLRDIGRGEGASCKAEQGA
ncbi:MAG: arsenate reductase ArsC [Novosphingobium sp.]|nr:arsenate reductase ArsC [Novosphingobium sp.]